MIIRSVVVASLLFAFIPFGWCQPANEPTAEANLKFALELYEQQDYTNAREKLEKAYEDFKSNEVAWKLAMSHYYSRDYRRAEMAFNRIDRRDKADEYPESQLWKARMMKMNGKYEEAIGELNDIVKSDADPYIKQAAALELEGANMAVGSKEQVRMTIENAGKEINYPGSEGSVFISPNGEELYYTSYMLTESLVLGKDVEPVYCQGIRAAWSEDKWGPGSALDDKINREEYNTGNISVSPSGDRLFFTRVIMKVDSMQESRIYVSNRESAGWGPAYELTGVNGDWIAKQPCVGELFGSEVLYFVSDKPGGHGGFDIYYAKKTGETSYADPINLGDVINGAGDEITPFYREGRLYFSTTSLPSFGGFDIHFSDWNGSVWSKPANLGQGFNSSVDDFGFSVDATGYKGALLSNRPEGKSLDSRTCCDDIYTFQISPIKLDLLASVKDGKVDGLLRGVQVQLIEMTGDKMGVTTTAATGEKGAAAFQLGLDKAYRIIASADGYVGDTLDFNTASIKEDMTFKKTLVMMPIPKEPEYEVYTTEEPIRLNSIYYDYDDDKILPESEPDLQLLLELMAQYGDMVIELSSHTDARGDDDYNQNLSQRRAQSATNWLLAKGVDPARIRPVGYGETQILNQCANGVECTDDEHRFNRRTEFKIISGPTSIKIEKTRLKSLPEEDAPSSRPNNNRNRRRGGGGDSVSTQPYATQPALSWDTDGVQFGKLKKGEQRDHVFTFTNTGSSNVTIEICSACDCMTLDWTTLPVKPGMKGTVKAHFDTSKKEVGDVVSDFINVILEQRDPSTGYPIIHELKYEAVIVE
ncbi:MAG: OmpA family protein [Saprospiraceae bacterium]|nr:OmpA family protein [Saprospiraceae bacterium]